MERGQSLSAPLRQVAARFDAPALATWLLGFALIAYLMLQEGGFDPIVRGEVGVVVWWIVLVGVALGVMPLPTRSRAAIALVGLLGAFASGQGSRSSGPGATSALPPSSPASSPISASWCSASSPPPITVAATCLPV